MAEAAAVRARPAGEAALVERWLDGVRPPLRLADGRSLRVVFPGVPGGGAGPDVRGAIVEAAGDLLRGDVEVHLRASGWRIHGHHRDPAYAGVVLHVVAENDTAAPVTLHGSRAVPLLVLPPPGAAPFPPPFVPPCAAASRHAAVAGTLARLGERRLRVKAERARLLAARDGPGQALYALALAVLGGPANREAFAALARRLPLAALLDEAATRDAPRSLVLAALLRAAAAPLALRRAGLRPLAAPERRLEAAAALFARLWPPAAPPAFPPLLVPGAARTLLQAPGVGRSAVIELWTNAVLPVALGTGVWPAEAVAEAFAALPTPGTYGRLRRLERWLGHAGEPPFTGARALQGGLLLHGEYCTRGACGRCPLSAASQD